LIEVLHVKTERQDDGQAVFFGGCFKQLRARWF
jgi:hypothetical protein